jgi:hypothetical protein
MSQKVPKQIIEYNMLLNIKAGGRNHIFRAGTPKQVETLFSKAHYAQLLQLIDGRQVAKEDIIGGRQEKKQALIY